MLCFKAQKTYQLAIVFLDDRELKCDFQGNQKCEQIMRAAGNFLCLHDKMDYFGLRLFESDKNSRWIDLTKSVESQFQSQRASDSGRTNGEDAEQTDPVRVYFCVKYYMPDPCKLRSEHLRYLFYLQLKKDVNQGRLPTQEYAVDLFGYFLQDELGDYNSNEHLPGYASEFEFSPFQPPELEAAAESKHKRLKGMSQQLAEMNFLNKVKWLDMYGVEMHPVRGEDNMEYNLGLTPTGICVYKSMLKVTGYFWPRITKLNCKQSKLILTVIDKSNVESTHVFELSSATACKQLWKTCVEHHRFFSVKAIYVEPLKLSTSLAMSKNRNSIRSLNQYSATGPQQMEVNNPSTSRSQDSIVRVPAKRLPSKRRIYTASQSNDPDSGRNDAVSNRNSPTQSYKSRKRRESTDSRVKGHHRTRSNTSRSSRYVWEATRKGSDNDNQAKQDIDAVTDGVNQIELKTPSNRRRRHRQRSNSRSSYKETSATDNKSSNEAGLIGEINQKSFNKMNKYHDPSETCHETSNDEMNDTLASEKKRQIRRRRRSKSPGVIAKPPEEIRNHIKYSLIETKGLSETELKEIPFVKIETTAPPFRISPHQRHRRISPHRRKSREFHESKSSVAYLSNGVAQIIKTETCITKEVVKAVPAKASIVSLATTDKTRLIQNKYSSNGFSADSGCEDPSLKQASTNESNEDTIASGYPVARSLVL